MPEQLSEIRGQTTTSPGSEKEKDDKSNWTASEKQSSLKDYGCEIVVDNGSKEEVSTKQAPTDASIVKYQHNDKECFDLTRGTKIRLFDMYWDKFRGGLKSIDFGQGTIKPNVWGYKSPQQKKKRNG